jgi:hypothetical protein
MIPLTDVSSINSVSNTTYDESSPTYSLQAKNGEYILITEISLGMDSNFLSVGYAQVSIAGQNVTSENSSSNENQFIANYTFNFTSTNAFVALEPGQSVKVNARVSSSSGKLQVGVSGIRLTQSEYFALRAKFLGQS